MMNDLELANKAIPLVSLVSHTFNNITAASVMYHDTWFMFWTVGKPDWD